VTQQGKGGRVQGPSPWSRALRDGEGRDLVTGADTRKTYRGTVHVRIKASDEREAQEALRSVRPGLHVSYTDYSVDVVSTEGPEETADATR
jgi:hypothetical protein